MSASPANASLGGYPAERADFDAAVDPFSYNPSAWSQRLPVCGLAMIAFFLATEMALYQWRLIDGVWDPFFETEKVIDSDIARQMHRWFGIPDAALGAVAYLGDAIFGLAGSTRRWQYRPWLVILFGIDVIPLGIVSAVLVAIQVLVLGDYCTPCLVTAAISLILVYLAYDEVYVSLKYLWLVKQRTGSFSETWKALLGRPTDAVDEVAASMIRENLRQRPSPLGDPIGRSVGSWGRVVELTLACWLAMSPFVFAHPADATWRWAADWGLAAVIAVAALLAYWPPLAWARIGTLVAALALIGFGYFGHDGELPPAALQNDLTVGILLLMFFFVPNDAGRPARVWYEKEPGLSRT